MTTRTPQPPSAARATLLATLGLVLLMAGSCLAATPAPIPAVPSNKPDHGPWLLVLIVLGFVLAGVATMALAHRNSRPRDE